MELGSGLVTEFRRVWNSVGSTFHSKAKPSAQNASRIVG